MNYVGVTIKGIMIIWEIKCFIKVRSTAPSLLGKEKEDEAG